MVTSAFADDCHIPVSDVIIMDMNQKRDLLTRSIKSRGVLKIFYQGGFRVIEPCILGINLEGKISLLAYQVSGHSRSGIPQGWKHVPLSEIRHIKEPGYVFYRERPGLMKQLDKFSTIMEGN